MLLVLGSALDSQPSALVDHWRAAGRDVSLVSPADLSQPGWTLRVGRPDATRAVVSGRVLTSQDIEAVVCALAWIAPEELTHVVPRDRDYVAQEITAFLLAWLQTLSCPVVDRPIASSLAGSGRSSWEWAALAASVGVDATPTWDGPTAPVTVVGDQPVETLDPTMAQAAVAIASAAGLRLVTLHFRPDRAADLVGAAPRAEVGSAAAATQLLALLDAA
jgi:hypothetical protein